MMKFAVAFLLAPAALAFAPSPTFMSKTSLSVGKDPNVIFGGNSWRPDSEKVNMGVSASESEALSVFLNENVHIFTTK